MVAVQKEGGLCIPVVKTRLMYQFKTSWWRINFMTSSGVCLPTYVSRERFVAGSERGE